MRMKTLVAISVSTLLAACGDAEEIEQAKPSENMGQAATLIDSTGNEIGSVEISEDGNGTTLHVEVAGLEEGLHGVHLHETGRCDPPDFASAGGHWNPSGMQHGRDNPAGSHLGDLANMGISARGDGKTTYLLAGVLQKGTHVQIADEDGTALIIHSGPDDYRTDPSGDSGARVACAVLAKPR